MRSTLFLCSTLGPDWGLLGNGTAMLQTGSIPLAPPVRSRWAEGTFAAAPAVLRRRTIGRASFVLCATLAHSCMTKAARRCQVLSGEGEAGMGLWRRRENEPCNSAGASAVP
ncbi:hypothetical protein SKAU_G00125440 [Synaphobranchus kaupii]|uniref:Uncharacterized protein n=1 Tax=Synaphobranchus kaupii TaxID=118154 RepID=A0A9Q1FQ73_SYNKA|nr:hypothetical protein SKAU_G00125440 [Synaphobranchus kaupii]